MKAQYVAGNGFRKVSCVVSIYTLFAESLLRVTGRSDSASGRSLQCDHVVMNCVY